MNQLPTKEEIKAVIVEEFNKNGPSIDLRDLWNREYGRLAYRSLAAAPSQDFMEQCAREVGLTQSGPTRWVMAGVPITGNASFIGSFALSPSPSNLMQSLMQGAYGNGTGQPAKPKKKTMKNEFEKGDRVELIEDQDGVAAGALGTYVSEAWDNAGIVQLDAPHSKEWNVLYKNMKKLELKPKVTIDSVILAPETKEQIRAAISQEDNNDLIFDKWGFSEVFEKGTAVSLLFYGTPGTGKTLMAQAIADEMGYKLKMYSTADIESSEPGGAERMIRTIFKAIKGKEKRVILFDECDSLLMDRNEVGPILGAQVNALLTEIERFGGIVIFTTNRLGKLDAALERRITAKIEFPFPDEEQRALIWERMIPKKAPVKDLVFAELAKHKLAGGNIKNAVLNAARTAAYKQSKHITMEHFDLAAKRETASLQAFADSFDQTPHHNIGGVQRGHGKRTVNVKEEVKIAKKMQVGQMFGMKGGAVEE